jgi:hypothetical protein
VIHHARALTLAPFTVAITVVFAGLVALAIPRSRVADSTTIALSPTVGRTEDLTTETGTADVEERVAPPTSDLFCCVVHVSGGEELDGIAELRENDLVDRTLLRRGRHRGLGVQPGPSFFYAP